MKFLQAAGAVLDTTALVHDWYLRLVKNDKVSLASTGAAESG